MKKYKMILEKKPKCVSSQSMYTSNQCNCIGITFAAFKNKPNQKMLEKITEYIYLITKMVPFLQTIFYLEKRGKFL